MDMAKFIVPKSDQQNADDFIAGPRTIHITRVTGTGSADQPVAVYFDGDDGKPWKPCKNMRRVLVAAWGIDASQYPGRSLTLYRDPSVMFGGLAVGGIRISHMSHIDAQLTLALTMTKSKRAPYRVSPLGAERPVSTAVRHHPTPDHVGSELGLTPVPEPRLLTPDGEVLPADRDGLSRWQKAWAAEFDRIDREPADVMAALVEHAPAAKAVFADRTDTVTWISAFVEKCKGRVAA